MTSVERGTGVRLSEMLALLSLGTDLGFGQPMEHAIRQCLIALKLAERLEMTQAERAVLYYAGLLAWVGCHTDAYEVAKWFGDDIGLRQDAAFSYDGGRTTDMVGLSFRYFGGRNRSLFGRARAGIMFVGGGWKDFQAIAENHYRATDQLAEKLGLGADVREALRESYERWDGKGAFGLRGEQTTLTSRLINLADVVEVFERAGGVDHARAVAISRRGTQFDPGLVDLFCDEASEVFADLEGVASWDAVVDAEPSLGQELSETEFDNAVEAIGDFADLKAPWMIGHARSVSNLAAAAAEIAGLPSGEVTDLRRAALLHDIGRLGISNEIWDKKGSLSRAEMERVRMHPYFTERMLSFSPGLATLGAIAVQHHERLDGSGYPRALRGESITVQGRILAAADAYQTMTEMRPHRPHRTPDDAAAQLRGQAQHGKFDGEAVSAVLEAAGHARSRRSSPDPVPAGLTARELEVLRLLVRGLSNKEIAERLTISRKTAGNHIEHIYFKTGATNRATASLFAMKHGLMVGI